MPSIYSDNFGSGAQGVSLDNTRRFYDFKDTIKEIKPADSVFFYLLSALKKMPSSDPIFKMSERRHQYQRRNFNVAADQSASLAVASGVLPDLTITVECDYDIYGRKWRDGTTFAPQFLLNKQDIVIKTVGGYTPNGGSASNAHLHFHVKGVTLGSTAQSQTTTLVLELYAINGVNVTTANNGDAVDLNNNDLGQVIGNSHPEASGAPEGWSDKLFDREGYMQIFKTACPMMSGTAMATELRSVRNEFTRIWAEKLAEHKMDMAQAFLFGVGKKDSSAENGEAVRRRTWGMLPYLQGTQAYVDTTFSYANSGYDKFLTFLLNWLEPESGVDTGSKVALTSRKIMKWLNQLGADGFLTNTLGSSHTSNIDIFPNRVDEFGFRLTTLDTVFGSINFYNEALLRGPWEDYILIVDMDHVEMRTLVGNGISRDTFIKTNIQDNDTDGRKDQILTEAGLQIDMPEKHAVIEFGA